MHKVLSKYRFPSTDERREYEKDVTALIDRILVRALAVKGIEASISEGTTRNLVVGKKKLEEVDQWRVSVVDHSVVHRVYSSTSGEEIEIVVALEKRPRIKIKNLVKHLAKKSR